MGVYFDTDGNAYTQSQVDARIRKAKEQAIKKIMDQVVEKIKEIINHEKLK